MSAMPMAMAAYGRNAPAPDTAIVTQHLDLVKRIAYHLVARLPASVDIDDLIQAGVIGLIEAARNYSGDRGARFETYASIRIRGAMVDELRRGDWAPRSVHRRMRDVSAAIREIEQKTGREARESEIVEKLGISAGDYHDIVSDAVQCQILSMDTAGSDDEEEHGIEAIAADATPADAVERAAFQKALAEAISELPERERLVMSLYYDEELNLREIGQVLEVTESRVCQLHGQALLRLRARLGDWRDDPDAAVKPRRAATKKSAVKTTRIPAAAGAN
ncbi:MAG: RNA polymerase sigma factor FliA [Nevskia sp.]|jgi:RNA polymerase sigma factor FliA|nr:RNA polymerase sigma factor FliA [Nevskia sp.]MCK9384102.1 RNA polymerase sigma factor FliA [Nevskia sp.]